MKKKSLYLSIILTIIGAIYACYDDQIDDLLKDYRFKTEIVNLNGQDFKDLYMHTETDFAIDIQKTSDIGSYKLSYTQEEGEGVLKYHDTIIEPGISVSCKEDRLKFRYIPASSGDHKLLFKLSNEAINVTERFEGQASKLYFQTEVIKLPAKPLVDKQFTFNLKLKKAADATTAKSFATSVTVLDGAGEIVFQQIDTIQTDSTQKNLFARSNSKDQNYLIEGENQLSYISRKAGKNVLQFQVTNSLGFSQSIDVPIDVYVPDFSVETITDTVADAGATNNFLLKVTDTDNHGQNIYQVAYRNLQNSGKLRINNNELQVGSTLQLQKGENICEFIPMELGEAALEFIVKDKYNSVKKDTAYFKVQKSETNINISDHERNITVYNTQNFNFAVNKKNYKGNYRFEIIQNPLNSVAIKVNGEDYKGGQISIVSPQNTLVSFIPSRPGDLKLTLKVYDDYNSESTSELNYTVENTQGKITISNQQQTLNLLETNKFNFAVSKPNYNDKYQFEISMFPLSGTLQVDGANYYGGRQDIANPLNTQVSFTPNKVGEVTMTLTVYDVFGGSFTETLKYTVTNTGIKLAVTNLEKGNIILGKETTFDFSATKDFYSGDLRFEIDMSPEDAGKLKVDGKAYSNFVGAYTTIKTGEKSIISFTPTKEGEANLLIKVFDEFGGETSYPVTYKVSNPPVKMEVYNYNPASVLNTENLLSLSLSKENYTGTFNYTISTDPIGTGTIKVNGEEYKGGKNLLDKPDNVTLSFTPTKEAETRLTLNIEDEIGGKLERTFTYKVSNPELNVLVTNPTEELTINKQASILFAVSKEQYTGKFQYQIANVEGCSDIKVNNTPYPADSRLDVPVITGTSITFIPSKVGKVRLQLHIFDEWGKTVVKNLEFTVTNSDIDLKVTNVENQVYVGKPSTFNFSSTKPNYTGNLSYEITPTPEGMGTLVVDGKTYSSGKIEFTAGKDVPVTFTPAKEGEVSFLLKVTDEFGGEKSQTINQVITNPAIKLEVINYTTEAIINTEKVFNFTTTKDQYTGAFNYSITTTPSGAGAIKINDKIYTGGMVPLENPANTKVSFVPSVAGEITVTLNVTDNVGGKIERIFTYNVTNPDLTILLPNIETDLTFNKTTSFNFSVLKPNYNGKFTFTIDADNCKDVKVNDIAYTLGSTAEVSKPEGMKVSLIPSSTKPINLTLKIFDEWGRSATQQLSFTVTNSDIDLKVTNVENQVYVGKPSTFNFSSTKLNYTGNLSYEITPTPEGMGSLVVDGKAYSSGKIEFSAGKDVSVTFTPGKEGEVSFLLKVTDEFGGEKSQTINQVITNPAIKLEVVNYTTEATINTEKVFNFTTTKDQYTGAFNYSITTTPSGAGVIKINDKIYAGGVVPLENPANTKVSFVPSVAGEITVTLNVTDNVGGKTERIFTYNVTNPDLSLVLANVESDITIDKTSAFNFAVNKANYTGKFNAIITGENCRDIKINDIAYSQNTPIEVSSTGTRVSFIPTVVGSASTKLQISVTDDWGKTATQDLVFNVVNSNISLQLKNVSPKLHVGEISEYSFIASKPNYTGNLKFEITPTPEGMGTLVVNGKQYVSGQVEIQSGKEVPVKFTPTKEGNVSFKLTTSDQFGGETVETISQSITNPAIKTEITGFVPEGSLNVENGFNFSVSKEYYTGKYNYIITTVPSNAAQIKVNDEIYNGGLSELTNPANTKVNIKPTTSGKITLNLIVTDATGGRWEKAFEYNIVNNQTKLVVSNQETAISLDKETSFNFAVSKANYTGKFTYEITSEPVTAGKIKVNGTPYEGGRTDVINPTNTKVSFIPEKIGATFLNVKIWDEFGGETEERLSYIVANSKFSIVTSNVEKTIQLGKPTTFNYSTVKENYSGSYKQEIIITPENAGEIKINGTAYNSGKVPVTNPVNTIIEFVSNKAGQNTLQLKVYDEFGGEAVENIVFNCVNPEISINTTNKEESIIYNTPTSFNVALAKKFYTGTFKYQISQIPANSGVVTVDGAVYDGGITTVTNPDNLRIGFTPTREGAVSLKLKIMDDVEGVIEEIYNFSVANPEIEVNVTNHTPDVMVNATSTFNFTAAKANYPGKLMYQIEQSPAGIASLKINGTTYTGGKLELTTPLNNTVKFTANKNCAIVLKLTVTDEWGKSTVKDIPFSVVNTDISINITNKEQDLLLSKATTLNFSVSKPNYGGTFKARVIDAENTGTIKFNNNSYSGEEIEVQANNSIEYTPKKLGAILLKLQVTDELGGEKEVPLSFNVTNPEIQVRITNKEDELIYNTRTNFNIALTKDFYVGTFDYEIEQVPANSGIVTVDDVAYPGGSVTATNHSNIRVAFTPTRAGRVSLRFRFTDKTGAEAVQTLDFNVTNPAIAVNVTGQTPDIKVNTPTTFNFTVSKPNYTGKFQYQLEESPVSGVIKINGTDYTGGKIDITNVNSNPISFTANKTGAVTLKLTVTDEWGISTEKLINYSVSNTDILVDIKDKEFDLLLNKATTLNFTVNKPNYSGSFKAEIVQDPENCGTIKLNSSAYSNGKVNLQENNTITFTPSTTGAVLLTLKIFDEHDGEKDVALNFNVTNPGINLTVTNKQENIIFNTATSLNVAMSKDYYSGAYDYIIEQIPAGSGTITVDGVAYNGGTAAVTNPANLRIGFTPTSDGRVSLKLTIKDKVGAEVIENLNFHVTNPAIAVNVTGQTKDIQANATTSFNFSVAKPNYTGKFQYQIVQDPADVGTIKVNGTAYSGGKIDITNINSNSVEFTPSKLGAVVLKLQVTDTWGMMTEIPINYSVSNTNIVANVTNNEYELLLNKATTFKFSVSKPNYSGGFTAKIVTDPTNTGTIKLNNSAHTGTTVAIQATNTVEFIPSRTGAIMMKIIISDDLGGEKEVPITFNVTNPGINLTVTNKQENIIFKTATNFNVAMKKDYYSGAYDYIVEQIPAGSGRVTIDGVAYSGGTAAVTNPANLRIGFTPTVEGRVSLKITIKDKVGGEVAETYDFNVTNPAIAVNVTGHKSDANVNIPTTFNFAVSKANYSGKFQYQIVQDPVNVGTIKVNGTAYSGGKIDITNISSNSVEFTPTKIGAVTLKLTITDEWGKSTEVPLSYSISNTDISIDVTNAEYKLLLNKATTFNFAVSKPNYSGGFTAKIVTDPTNTGTIKLNNSAHTGTAVALQANNTVVFTPTTAGAIVLKILVSDNLGGEKEIAIPFTVENPAIEVTITNKESSVLYKSTTTFNASISKANYSGKFNYRISTSPAAAGAITVGGKAHTGNYTEVSAPAGLQIGFTPVIEGYVSLLLEIEDETGNKTEKTLDFNVTNPAVNLTINNSGTDLTLGSSHSFSISASKQGYTGAYTYEVTQYPYAAGDMTVAGSTSLSGKLTANPANITFKPTRLGAIVLNIKITDEWSKSVEKQIDFNVSNSPITLAFVNNESNVVLNNPTNFNFKATKANYSDSETVTYSITPATSMGTLTVDGKAYNGTEVSVSYGKIKAGLPVVFTPTREGVSSLTFMVKDTYGTTTTKTIDFNVANPELSLFLAGVNTGQANEVTLGETFKYTFNVDKANYSDDFAYIITLSPSDAGTIATSDITPRSVGVVTGTLQKGSFGVSTGEIRFTPSNSTYLNQNVTINVEVRDKWGNKKNTSSTFNIKTSAINVNMNRKTSIPVEEPYVFYFMVDKAGYSGKFTYQLTGWNDGEKIETSADGSKYTTYNGGKYDLPHKDHSYIRYTPAKVGTVPLKLFVYDENSVEVMKELTFDVKVPEVKIATDRTSASGYMGDFIPFKLTATDEKGEDLNVSFALENSSFNGTLRFNGSEVTPNTRSRVAGTTVITNSGKVNTFEMASRDKGNFAATTTAQNRWGSKAAVTTSISVTEMPRYTISTSTIGSGTVSISPSVSDYESGTNVTITAEPAEGWKFVRWQGSVSGNMNPLQVTVTGEMNVVAVFEENKVHVVASVSPNYGATGSRYCKGTIEVIINGNVASKKDQTSWINSSMLLSTDIPKGTKYTIRYNFYISTNGSSPVTSGTVKLTSGETLNISNGGLIQYEISGTAGDNAGSFGHDHGIIIRSVN